MVENIYQVTLSVHGLLTTIVTAKNQDNAIDSAKARTANIERHLSERLNTDLDVSYDIETIELIDSIEGDYIFRDKNFQSINSHITDITVI